jgi:hypothetical protein
MNFFSARPAGRMAMAIGAVLAALSLGGCVTLPTNGQVSMPGGLGRSSGGQLVQGVQLVPVPPGQGWSPSDIVRGFLAATGATWTGLPQSIKIARLYLAPSYRTHWRPSWSATVIGATPAVTEIHPPSRLNAGPPRTVVRLTTRTVETLHGVQYGAGSVRVSSRPTPFNFTLSQVGGQWRIEALPSDKILLLTAPDFARDYEPRDRYFFPADSSANVLVPDPVYIPQQAGVAGVKGLVRSLLTPPSTSSWLFQAAATAFPPGTTLKGVQVPGGVNAVVDLGGAALRADPATRQRMLAQLFFTLTESPYGTSGGMQIRTVTLQLGHHSWAQLPGSDKGWLPGGQSAPLLYVPEVTAAAAPELTVLRAGTSAPVPVALPAGLGRGPFSAIAVSTARVLAACRGKTIYIVALTRGARPVGRPLPAACNSLSWDNRGDLWVAAGPEAYTLRAGPNAGTVSGPFLVANGAPASTTISTIRVAPDGVRVAMIVHDKAGSHIVVGAARRLSSATSSLANSGQLVTVGSDITGPIGLSWWGPDHLLVLARPGHSGLQLDEAPLDGGPATTLITQLPAGVSTLTASWPYQQVVLGTQGRPVKIAPNGAFRLVLRSGSPVYPG